MTFFAIENIIRDMEAKVLKCTYCGAKIPFADSEFVTCPSCDSVIHFRYAKKLGESEDRAAELKALRTRLLECVSSRYHDFEEMKSISDDILSLTGYDFEAKYFYALSLKMSNKRVKYNEFLSSDINTAPGRESLDLVVENMIRYARENERTLIHRFIKRNFSDRLEAEELIDRADRRIERSIKDFHGGQDVFICHKSSDGAVANTVAERLESSGITCFLSERNLEDLEVGEKFENALKNAIASCRILLLISSYRAFSRDEENYVMFELAAAKAMGKPNAEFRIEQIDRATESLSPEYTQYFDGCQYIEAYPDFQDMLDKLYLHLAAKLEKIKGGESETVEELRIAARQREEEIQRLKAEKEALAAVVGNTAAMANFASRSDGAAADEVKSFNAYQGAASDGDAEAQYNLALCYKGGIGTDKNPDLEKYWLEKAAEQGNREAQEALAEKIAAPNERALAVSYYKKGYEYDLGQGGVKPDSAKAVYWYQKAAEMGNDAAQLNLGVCYEYGRGVKKDAKTAVKYYVLAAEAGNAAAQCNLGYCYYNGNGVTRDFAKAVIWYKKAAENGSARAYNNLGYCYERGEGIAKNAKKAVEYYTKSASLGDMSAACNCGWCYESGIGVDVDLTVAREWYAIAREGGYQRGTAAFERVERKIFSVSSEVDAIFEKGEQLYEGSALTKPNRPKAAERFAKAARLGHIAALYRLGMCYKNGDGIKQNYPTALRTLEGAAKGGHSGAMYEVFEMYMAGLGTERNVIKAVSLLKTAASAGNSRAQYRLGIALTEGTGVERNAVEAVKWLRRAASYKNTEALCALGAAYYSGNGVERDYDKAIGYFKMAAGLNHAPALLRLGCCYYNGTGVARDYSKAFEYFTTAANEGSAAACYNAGRCCENGEGTPQSLDTAITWYRKGAQKGDPDAQRALGQLMINN